MRASIGLFLGVLGGKFIAQSYAGDGISKGMPADFGLLIEAQGSYYWGQIFISKISDVIGGLYTRISVYGGASYTSWKEI